MNLNINYLTTIYKGFLDHKSAKQISRELYNQTIQKGVLKDAKALDYAIKLTNKLGKKLPQETHILQVAKLKYNDDTLDIGGALSMILFDELKNLNAYENLKKATNQKTNDIEAEFKEEVIKDTIEYNRGLDTPKVFYLASSHNDCAKDHKIAQGKIYIDEAWENYITSEKLKKQIKEYIAKHHTQTIQYIMGDPVWFITRPNCRHYFVAIKTKEAIKVSSKRLSSRYKTDTAISNRQYLQTLRSGGDRKIIGEKRNAELMIQKYEERLKYHLALKQVKNNLLVRKSIVKDKMLIAKWKEYLKKLK